jgi:hypothetical protein
MTFSWQTPHKTHQCEMRRAHHITGARTLQDRFARLAGGIAFVAGSDGYLKGFPNGGQAQRQSSLRFGALSSGSCRLPFSRVLRHQLLAFSRRWEARGKALLPEIWPETAPGRSLADRLRCLGELANR